MSSQYFVLLKAHKVNADIQSSLEEICRQVIFVIKYDLNL